jgi:hypothetical protein
LSKPLRIVWLHGPQPWDCWRLDAHVESTSSLIWRRPSEPKLCPGQLRSCALRHYRCNWIPEKLAQDCYSAGVSKALAYRSQSSRAELRDLCKRHCEALVSTLLGVSDMRRSPWLGELIRMTEPLRWRSYPFTSNLRLQPTQISTQIEDHWCSV